MIFVRDLYLICVMCKIYTQTHNIDIHTIHVFVYAQGEKNQEILKQNRFLLYTIYMYLLCL